MLMAHTIAGVVPCRKGPHLRRYSSANDMTGAGTRLLRRVANTCDTDNVCDRCPPLPPVLPNVSSDAAPGPRLLALWRRLSVHPAGAWIFSRLLGRKVPYSGTLGARVVRLDAGHAVVSLRDRRHVRNHLGSVHAIALANLGELASGLATLTSLPPGVRGIVTDIRVEYLKKARGRLTAETRVEMPPIRSVVDQEVLADIRDGEGALVARVHATWRLAPPS